MVDEKNVEVDLLDDVILEEDELPVETPQEEAVEETEAKEEVSEVVEDVPNEEPVVVEESSGEVETFKAQLSQALELNDRLIQEVQTRDKEISVFREVKFGLESVIEKQQNEITQLKDDIQALKTEKLNEQITGIAQKWVKKYGLGEEKLPDIIQLLQKYNADELVKVEQLLDVNKGKEKSSPVPLTQGSAVLVEQFAEKPTVDYQTLTPEQKRDLLYEQLRKASEIERKNI